MPAPATLPSNVVRLKTRPSAPLPMPERSPMVAVMTALLYNLPIGTLMDVCQELERCARKDRGDGDMAKAANFVDLVVETRIAYAEGAK